MNLLSEPFLLPEPWTLDAACSQIPGDYWFPDDTATATKAKRVCATCPVIEQCREYAARTNQRTGIWAGVKAKSIKRSMRGVRKMTMLNLAPGATPTTYAHEPSPHVCGKCRNPYTVGNPNCPNNRNR